MAEEERFSLYCAYPKAGFTQNIEDSIRDICCAHSRVVEGRGTPSCAPFGTK